MKSRIEKLIAEYNKKIAMCDKTLNLTKKDNIVARRDGDEELMQVYREERREWEARKGAYVQAKADIESFLDFCEGE